MKSKEELIGEMLRYRQLVKTQRKILEGLSQKVSVHEEHSKVSNDFKKIEEALREQVEYYKAKNTVLIKQIGLPKDINQQILKQLEIDRQHDNNFQERL